MNEKEAAVLGFPSGTGEFDYLGFLRSLWRLLGSMLAMDPRASMTVISAFGYVLSIPSVTVLMFIIGLIISVRAQMTINTNYSWTLEIREGHTLVEDGLYRYVRHPIYLGTIIRLISIPIFTSSLPGFILGLLSIPLLIYRIGLEEEMLIEEFGEEYERYRERTWTLFPYIYWVEPLFLSPQGLDTGQNSGLAYSLVTATGNMRKNIFFLVLLEPCLPVRSGREEGISVGEYVMRSKKLVPYMY